HGRDHRRRRQPHRYAGRSAFHRPDRRGHVRLLHADAGQDCGLAAGRLRCRAQTDGAIRRGSSVTVRVQSGGVAALARANRLVWGVHLAVAALLLLLQFVLPPFHHGMLARIMVLASYAIGYNILLGYAGLMSLGHAMFFAAGMYGTGLTVYYLGLGALPAILIGLLTSIAVALVIGWITFHYKWLALTISGAVSGLAGSTYTLLFSYLGSSFASILYSIYPLLWTLVGGVGTLIGPLVGATMMTYVVDITSGYTT